MTPEGADPIVGHLPGAGAGRPAAQQAGQQGGGGFTRGLGSGSHQGAQVRGPGALPGTGRHAFTHQLILQACDQPFEVGGAGRIGGAIGPGVVGARPGPGPGHAAVKDRAGLGQGGGDGGGTRRGAKGDRAFTRRGIALTGPGGQLGARHPQPIAVQLDVPSLAALPVSAEGAGQIGKPPGRGHRVNLA